MTIRMENPKIHLRGAHPLETMHAPLFDLVQNQQSNELPVGQHLLAERLCLDFVFDVDPRCLYNNGCTRLDELPKTMIDAEHTYFAWARWQKVPSACCLLLEEDPCRLDEGLPHRLWALLRRHWRRCQTERNETVRTHSAL